MSDDLETMLHAIVARVAAEQAQELAPAPNRWVPYDLEWDAAWDIERTDVDWLIEPLIARGRGHALYAGAKVGKSFLMLEACAALSTGRPILARDAANDRHHTMYVDFEMTKADVIERLEAYGYTRDDAVALGQCHYYLLPAVPPFDGEEGGRLVVDQAKELGAELVVIDTMSRAVAGLENESQTYQAFYRHTGQLLKAAGIAYVRLDHAGKDIERGQRGSSAKNDDVDVVWQMTKRDGGFRMTATHRRMSWVPPEFDIALIEDELTGHVTHRVVPLVQPEGSRRINAALDGMGAPWYVTKKEARDLLKKAGEKCANEALVSALRERKKMTEKGDGPPSTSIVDALIGDRRGSKRENPGQNPGPDDGPARTSPSSPSPSVSPPYGGTDGPDHKFEAPKRVKRDLW